MTAAAVIEKWPELRKLTGEQLLEGVERTLAMERDAQLRFLLYLAEVERSEAYELANTHSLWTYIEKELGFSEYETRLRFHSARLLVSYPIIAEYLGNYRLSMTTLVEMKDVLTSATVRDWCEKASNKSRAQVEKLVAESRTLPVIDFGVLTQGPAPQVIEVTPPGNPQVEPSSSPSPAPVVAPSAPGASFTVINAPSRAQVKALTARQSQLMTTLTNEAAADLEELRDLLSEIFPDRSIPKVVAYCLKEVKERIHKKRGKIPVKARAAKKVATPESTSATPVSSSAAASALDTPAPESDQDSPVPEPDLPRKVTVPKDAALEGRNRDRKFTRDSIPVWVARIVWLRDNHRCQRKLKGGKICGSTYRCQLDHILAVADGGTNDPSNLQVHCRIHNLRRARERFGNERIAAAIRKRQAGRKSLGVSVLPQGETMKSGHFVESGGKSKPPS